MDKKFINDSISYGISNYLLIKQEKDYDKTHIFEVYVIRCLCKIYSDLNIINPYRIFNENSFKSNLIMYGLPVSEMNEFIKLLDDYSRWLNSKVNVDKTNITSKIELILINMILYKNNINKFSSEDVKFFDKFFNPLNNNLEKLHSLITKDIDIVPMYWNRKKSLLNNSLKFKLIRHDLLSSSTYNKYGIDYDDISKMSEDKVKNINNRILEKEKEENKKKKKFNPKNVVISSGNGFVDTLMLLSIMTTEIMIGVMVALYFIRR